VNATFSGPRLLSRYSDSPRTGRSGDRIPVVGEIFRKGLDRFWSLTSLLYDGYRVFPGRGVDHQPPSSTEVKESVEL